MGSLTSALDRLLSSYSLKYLPSCQPSIQQVYVAFMANSDLCLLFLQRCVDYGEKVIGCRLHSIPLPASFRVMTSYDPRERTVRFQSEMTGIFAENAEERWEKARDSVRAAMAILKNEPVPQSFHRPAPTAINTLRSVT